ncbi:hypothetical protein B0H14DRAFT_3571045 [Mycena olivaceomarginata]|nr:hypothetical protein B0H14DRAFT_3571045 [Mycena olivaceomarginata]
MFIEDEVACLIETKHSSTSGRVFGALCGMGREEDQGFEKSEKQLAATNQLLGEYLATGTEDKRIRASFHVLLFSHFLAAETTLESCKKGNKCKFSHDLNVDRKVEKNLYADSREEKMNSETQIPWKYGTKRSWHRLSSRRLETPRTTTDIVCKHFIQVIETQKFGWFGECPNGEDCQYRHALPPGFVLRSQKKAAEEAAKSKVISLEEFLEVERHKLGTNLTLVTPESSAVWKKTCMDKKEAEQEALRKAKEQNRAAGKSSGMSRKDLVSGTALPSSSLPSTEIRLSIHNEAGNKRLSPRRRRARFLPFKNYRKNEVVLLVNNLGGMSELEMDTIVGDGDCGLTLKAGVQGVEKAIEVVLNASRARCNGY